MAYIPPPRAYAELESDEEREYYLRHNVRDRPDDGMREWALSELLQFCQPENRASFWNFMKKFEYMSDIVANGERRMVNGYSLYPAGWAIDGHGPYKYDTLFVVAGNGDRFDVSKIYGPSLMHANRRRW